MLLRRLLNLDVLGAAVGVAREQQTIIHDQLRLITRKQAEIEELKLSHIRSVRDLVEHFLYSQQQGIDVTEDLERGLEDLRDHVARLEEHAR
jgi:hypothetical protein